jgi:hypothetical protein
VTQPGPALILMVFTLQLATIATSFRLLSALFSQSLTHDLLCIGVIWGQKCCNGACVLTADQLNAAIFQGVALLEVVHAAAGV